MPNASLPPPPPPDCKVLGRFAVASALTLAAVVGGANLAHAQALPDPPCVAATHFEINDKCLPKTGSVPNNFEVCEVFGGRREGDNCRGYAVNVEGDCTTLGGTFGGSPFGCMNFRPNPAGPDGGSCQVLGLTNAENSGCGATHFDATRDCNQMNKVAGVAFGGLHCAATACTGDEKAIGGKCQGPGVVCTGDLVQNPAKDACVCPTAKPHLDAGSAAECVAQCGPGETLNQAANQCELCGTGEFKTAAGNGQCESCFPPLTESANNPGVSPLAGLQISRAEANRATGCTPIDECDLAGLDPAAKALELCGPNATCNDLDPRDNPNGFTVREWRYKCECNDGFSDSDQGDHERKLNCSGTGARTVAILDSPGGTVSSTPPAGDVDFETRVVFTAAPDLGFMVSLWSGADEWVRPGNCDAGAARCEVTVTRAVTVGATFGDLNECDFTTGPNRFNCPSDSSCENLDATLGGDRFTCACDEALYDFDSVRVRCGCATAGHLLFGEGGDRECKSPVICPAGYGDSNFDCVEDEATPLTSSQVESIVLCEAFGGLREAVVDSAHPGVCSEVDINDTFCFLESGEALSCRGLFEHVRDCNALNRPALDPWHCAAACGDKQARGRRCETVTR